FVRRAMGGPARVADAGVAVQRVLAQHRIELGELSRRPAAFDVVVGEGRNAGGIIAAIFQPLQRIEDDGGDVRGSGDADDAAHYFAPRLAFSAFLRARNFSAQPLRCFCSARSTASAPASISLVMIEPAPVLAPAPTRASPI